MRTGNPVHSDETLDSPARSITDNPPQVTGRDQPNRYVPRPIASLIAWVERMNIRHSQLGNPPVYDARVFPWVAEVEAGWPKIREELELVMKRRESLPSFHDITSEVLPITQDDRWKTFFLAGYGMKAARNAKTCPETMRLLKKIPGLKTAFFSILSPGKRIPVHKGAYNGVLRYHLGLIVPEKKESCRIRIEGRTMHWEAGSSLVFDDTFRHEVHNDTPEYRAILFVDFVRPVRFPFSLLNRCVLAVAPRMPILREARSNHLQWEREFYGEPGSPVAT